VPRGNWTRLTDMLDELHRNYSSAAYVFRNNYFFLELPPAPHETVNITFLRYRQKVRVSFRQKSLCCFQMSVVFQSNVTVSHLRYRYSHPPHDQTSTLFISFFLKSCFKIYLNCARLKFEHFKHKMYCTKTEESETC